MPIYEFSCTGCGRSFEHICRSSGDCSDLTCPGCGSSKVNKKFSTFAFSSGRKDSSSASSGTTKKSGCGSCSTRHCSTCH